ncbi:type III secretion system stator protein SctL [Pseudomonas sp. KBW05]|jgi:type III secretion protein L|uniref:type III secretion system stator protein SctL n=1 Tax=Pseudomonas sp. KBW05 TaxID=2153360 RepID=UPI000F59A611|nr:type III secretion system stator protein SctL [Pseudomonas sp. KBW05]RQO44031.1 HrpE/YscL family type III secretion apparatus protein [Pseudomonas sp. KBW05]
MLCKHRIELHESARNLSGPLITRETLADFTQAKDVINRANTQSKELLHQAEIKHKELLEQAALEMWKRADAQLRRWESDRLAMCQSLEHYATSVANEAIRSLLEETPAPKRLAALIKQLLTDHVHAVKATLFCHPLELDEIEHYLSRNTPALWKLQPDDMITLQTLVLKTDEGDFVISWRSMLEAFFTKHETS